MANVRSGVVEITWKSDRNLGSQEPCEVIYDFLRTPETERVDYGTPRKRLTGVSRFDYQDANGVNGVYHVFVQVTLRAGHFGNYADSLQARARVHPSVSNAVWRRWQSLVRGGTAFLGEVCVGDRPMDDNE